MSLVPDYEDSTESETSDSDDSASGKEEREQYLSTPKDKLPAPNFGGTPNATDDTKSSVFKNPFTEAENAKEAILQKHVKMVESTDNTVLINGKKICWNYRKGRCRFGHKCKFAHDSDIQKSGDQIEAEKKIAIQNSLVCQSDQGSVSVQTASITNTDSEVIDGDLDCFKQKRKRPGLTQGLKPGKKVMKQYLKHQKK